MGHVAFHNVNSLTSWPFDVVEPLWLWVQLHCLHLLLLPSPVFVHDWDRCAWLSTVRAPEGAEGFTDKIKHKACQYLCLWIHSRFTGWRSSSLVLQFETQWTTPGWNKFSGALTVLLLYISCSTHTDWITGNNPWMDTVSCHKYIMSKLHYANLSPQWIEINNDWTVEKVKNKEISLGVSLSHCLSKGV